MKKFRLFKILSIFTIAAAGAVAVGVGTKAPKVEAAKADSAPYVGSIAVEFQLIGEGQSWAYYWDTSNAKVAFYAFNNTTGESYGWSSMITTTAGTHRYEIPYSFSHDPFIADTQFHLVRFNSNHSDTPDWNDIWNRCDNIGFSQLIYIYNNDGQAAASSLNQAANYINSSGSANNVRLSYNKFSTNVECYRKTVSIAKDEQFTINFNNTNYSALKSGVDSTYFTVVSNKIKCNVTGTYDLYFDTNTKELWVQVDAVTEATGFAQKLLDATDSICSTGGSGADHSSALKAVWNPKTTPDGTSLVEKWKDLTEGARSEFRNTTGVEDGDTLEEGVYRYCHIMMRYGPSGSTSQDLQAFENGPAYPTIGNSLILDTLGLNDGNGLTIAIIVISLASVSALASFYIIRKRKHI